MARTTSFQKARCLFFGPPMFKSRMVYPRITSATFSILAVSFRWIGAPASLRGAARQTENAFPLHLFIPSFDSRFSTPHHWTCTSITRSLGRHSSQGPSSTTGKPAESSRSRISWAWGSSADARETSMPKSGLRTTQTAICFRAIPA